MTRIEVLALGLCVSIGCRNAVAADDEWGESSVRYLGDSLALDVAITRSTMRPGDTATVVVWLTNRLSRDVTVSYACGQLLYVIVETQSGAVISPLDPGFCGRIVYTITLSPHETVSERFPWGATGVDNASGLTAPLGEGNFRVYGALDLVGSTRSGWIPITLTNR